MKKQALGIGVLMAVCGTVVAIEPLNVFQITAPGQYNNGPAVPRGRDNREQFGFKFHNGKMAAVWMENSEQVSNPLPPPAVAPNFVFGSAQVNAPQDVIIGPNVIVSPSQATWQSEPDLAINPKDTNKILVVGDNRNDFTALPPAPFALMTGFRCATTQDGGTTWNTNTPLLNPYYFEDSKMPIPRGWESTEIRAAYDRHENLFISYVSGFSPDGDSLGTTQYPLFLYLCVSTDNGKSFKVVEHKFNPRDINPDQIFYDFDELAIGLDQVGVSISNYFDGFASVTGELFIFPVTGKGKIGDATHITIPSTLPNTGNGAGSMSFSPAGGLLVAQTANATFQIDQSCDTIFTSFLPKGATTFPADTSFQLFKNVGVGGFATYPPQPNRNTWSQPKVNYVYNSHHYGRVYMAYLDNPNVPPGVCNDFNSDTNVFVVYSDNDGKTWSAPFPIPKTNTNTRIMPQISIDQTTGNIGVAWLDAVNDPANVNVQVFATVIPYNYFD